MEAAAVSGAGRAARTQVEAAAAADPEPAAPTSVEASGRGTGSSNLAGSGGGGAGEIETVEGPDLNSVLPSRWGNATSGIRSSRSARTAGSMAVETGLMTLHEDELQGILQVLAQIARTGDAKDRLDPSSFSPSGCRVCLVEHDLL